MRSSFVKCLTPVNVANNLSGFLVKDGVIQYQGRTQDLELGGPQRAEGRKGGWVREGASPPPAPARGFGGARCKLPHWGLGLSPRSFRTIRNFIPETATKCLCLRVVQTAHAHVLQQLWV